MVVRKAGRPDPSSQRSDGKYRRQGEGARGSTPDLGESVCRY